MVVIARFRLLTQDAIKLDLHELTCNFICLLCECNKNLYIIVNLIPKRTSVFRPGALSYYVKQNEGEQKSYTFPYKLSANDLDMLLCCTELPYQIHPGIPQAVTFNLIPSCIAPCHRQLSIETATYSLERPRPSGPYPGTIVWFLPENHANLSSSNSIYHGGL